MTTSTIMRVNGYPIAVDSQGYICLTDMAKAKAGEAKAMTIINDWLKTQSAMGYLGLWEIDNNPNFKQQEFLLFKNAAGKKNFYTSVGTYVDKTDATGLYVKAGRYSGIYAHKDIAYEFGTAISVEFRYLVFKEYQRLKEAELNKDNPEWNVRRVLCKATWVIQTDAVKSHKIPFLPSHKHHMAYAEEGDILNLAIFGMTAKNWREEHLELTAKGNNIRDFASINELMVLTTLEGMNAEMIKSHVSYSERLANLKRIAKEQMETLSRVDIEKSFRKTAAGTFKPLLKAPGD